MRIISGLRLIFLSLGLLAVGLVHAQPFPGKTIQYIIPFRLQVSLTWLHAIKLNSLPRNTTSRWS